jgi:GT2 family glycosyltransferase
VFKDSGKSFPTLPQKKSARSAIERLWRRNAFVTLPLYFVTPADHAAEHSTSAQSACWSTSTEIGGESKIPLLMRPPARVSYRMVLPEGSFFEALVAVIPEVWGVNQAAVEFCLTVSPRRGGDELRKKIFVHSAQSKEQNRWIRFRLDLEKFANQGVELILSTAVPEGGLNDFVWSVWDNAVILSRKTNQEIYRLFVSSLRRHGFLGVFRRLAAVIKKETRVKFSYANTHFVTRALDPIFTPELCKIQSQSDCLVDRVSLSAIEAIDQTFDTTIPTSLNESIRDPQLPDVLRAYLYRISEAMRVSFRNKQLLPKAKVKASSELLKNDFLSLVFLYHLFSFREVSVEFQRANDAGTIIGEELPSLHVEDEASGKFELMGDGKQTLIFTNVESRRVVRRNIGQVLRQLSLDPLADDHQELAINDHLFYPSFSIVMPVYDRTHELIRAIASVLNQDYPWCELVLVFNGPPMGTLRLAPKIRALTKSRRFRQKVIVLPYAYGSANIPRNIGCFAATGDFIVFLDSDDCLATPDFISRLSETVSKGGKSSSIFYPVLVDFINIDRDYPIRGQHSAARPFSCDWNLLVRRGNILNSSGVCVTKRAFLASGGINPAMDYCEDYELFLRLLGKDKVALAFDSKVYITLHKQNNEIQFERQKAEWEAKARAYAADFHSELVE